MRITVVCIWLLAKLTTCVSSFPDSGELPPGTITNYATAHVEAKHSLGICLCVRPDPAFDFLHLTAQDCTRPPPPDFWRYYYAVIFSSVPDQSVNLCTLVDILNILLIMELKLYVVTIVTCGYTNTVLACPLLHILNLTRKRTGFATEDLVMIVTPSCL